MRRSTLNRIQFTHMILISLVLLMTQNCFGDEPYGNLKLLDGYRYKRQSGVDTIKGQIIGGSGFTIEFESGTGAGYAADPKKRNEYSLFREQNVNGQRVYIALTNPESGTNCEPENRRNSKMGKIVLVTFPGKMSPLDAANFCALVKSDEEIADMLLMVLTFDPRK